MIKADMVAGEPFRVVFKFRQGGVPYPIAGIPLKVELRNKSPEGPVLAMWDDDSPEISRDDQLSEVILVLPPSVTNQLNFKEAYTDLLLMEDPEGLRSKLIQVTLDRGATR